MVKVLLVDRDPGIREVTRMLLETAGFETVTLDSGTLSLADIRWAIRAVRPALLILGTVHHPDCREAWDLACEIKAVLPQIPIVLLTTSPVIAQQVAQTERGRCFAAAIVEPFDVDRFLTTLQEAVARSGRSSATGWPGESETDPFPEHDEGSDQPQHYK